MEPTQSRKRFAELVRIALSQSGNRISTRYDPTGFALVIGEKEGDPLKFNLTEAFRDFSVALPQDRHRVVLSCANGFSSARGCLTAAEAMPRLLLCLRERMYYEDPGFTLLDEGARWSALPHRLVCDHLAVGLACDFPPHIVGVDDTLLARWGLTEEAFIIARENLKRRSEAAFDSPSVGLYVSPWKDNHDASRLVLPEIICECEVRGVHIAAVPSNNCLIVTGSEDIEGLRAMFDLIEASFRRPWPLNGIPLCLIQGQWVPLELESGHPEFLRLRAIRLASERDTYERQKEGIYSHYGDAYGRLPEFFVATFMLGKDAVTGDPCSCCTWTEGVPAVLPRTNRIGFVRPLLDSKFRMEAACGWDRAQSIVGNLMVPVGMYPERYRVDQFPSPEQLAALGLESRFEGT